MRFLCRLKHRERITVSFSVVNNISSEGFWHACQCLICF